MPISAILSLFRVGQSLSSRPAVLLSAGLVIAYMVNIGWLHQVDIYHRHFFEHGILIAVYQLARLFFFFALAWLVYAVGVAVVAMFAGPAFLWRLPAFERYPLGFFVGSAIWHLVLYVLGFAGLYMWPVMAGMTVVVAALSIGHLARCVDAARSSRSKVRWPATLEDATAGTLVITLMAVAAAFIVIRGAFPLGGHDYYMHYFSYLTEVARSGSLQPNAAWYHFYDSKGVSLLFLSMILTDPTAPGPVTTMFAGFGVCLVYAILRHATGSRLLPLCGAILYVVFFAIGNDELEKQHVTTAVLTLAMLWTSIRLLDEQADRRPWIIALVAAVVTSILITVELGLLIVIYLAGLVAWFSWRREWRRALEPFCVASLAVFCVLGTLVLNYIYTGLPLQHMLLEAWPYADLNRLRDWGILYEVIALHYSFASFVLSLGHSSIFAPAHIWSWSFARALVEYFRLPLWWPLLVPVALFIPWRLWNRTARKSVSARYLWAILALFWFLICILAVAIMIGTAEETSFRRLMSLAYPVPLCLILLLWHFALHPLKQTSKAMHVVRVAAACATLVVLWPLASYSTARPEMTSAGLKMISANGWRFFSGLYSLKEAYQNQLGWEGKHPTGGIFSGVEEPWKIVGPNTPILAFHIHAYCMLPACNIVIPVTFRLGKQWRTAYAAGLETADRAAAQLRSDGLNYFFISMELPFFPSFQGLFSPTEIRTHLAVRWTDGKNYLLTWPGPDTTPIDDKFMAFYTKAMGVDLKTPCEQDIFTDLCAIFHHIERHAANLRPFALPWCKNCAGLPKVNE